MVRAVNTEDATDASIAVAMLIAGVVAAKAESADEAKSLMVGIHALSERFISAWLRDEKDGALN
jgi:hypothetical protein